MSADPNGCSSSSNHNSRDALRLVMIWTAVTLASFGLGWVISQPGECVANERCREVLEAAPSTLNMGSMCGLLTVFTHEVVSAVTHYTIAKPLEGLIDGVMDNFLPAQLVCVMFGVLIFENLNLSFGVHAFFAHTSSAGTPIDTSIYIEWLINVPILITLAGYCALNRSLSDLSVPLLVTNVYIVISWISRFMEDPTAKWSMVVVAFVMYGWASVDMARWAVVFVKQSSEATESRTLRPFLCIALIVVFGIYGGTFMMGMTGHITAIQERVWFSIMNVVVKLSMSMAFSTMRSAHYYEKLVTMIVNREVPFERARVYPAGRVDSEAVPLYDSEQRVPV